MDEVNTSDLVEEATLDFSLGEEEAAEGKLLRASELAPECVDAWRALAEVRLARQDLPGALTACGAGVVGVPAAQTSTDSVAQLALRAAPHGPGRGENRAVAPENKNHQ